MKSFVLRLLGLVLAFGSLALDSAAGSTASVIDPHAKIQILEQSEHQRRSFMTVGGPPSGQSRSSSSSNHVKAEGEEDPIERAVRRVQSILEEGENDGWELVRHDSGKKKKKGPRGVGQVKVLKKLLPGLDGEASASARFCCIKAQGIVRASPSALLELLGDGSRCREYNSFYAQGRPLQMLDPFTKVVWTATPSLWLFKARDFCTAIHWRRLSDGAVAVINRCFQHPSAPPTSKYIRGQVLLGASIVRPVPGDPSVSHLTLINHLDPGGSAPVSLVNRLAATGPISLFSRIEAAANRRKK